MYLNLNLKLPVIKKLLLDDIDRCWLCLPIITGISGKKLIKLICIPYYHEDECQVF